MASVFEPGSGKFGFLDDGLELSFFELVPAFADDEFTNGVPQGPGFGTLRLDGLHERGRGGHALWDFLRRMGIDAPPALHRLAGRADDVAAYADILRGIERGRPLKDLVGGPGQIPRDQFNRFKRTTPSYAADIEAASRRSRLAFNVSEATWDLVAHQMRKLGSIAAVAALPEMPTEATISAKIRRDPSFKSKVAGHYRAVAPKWPPEAYERALLAIRNGTSLRALGRLPGLPREECVRRHAARNPEFAARLEACVEAKLAPGASARERRRELRKRAGRGTKRYSDAAFERAAELIAAGHPIRSLAAQGLPSEQTILRRQKADAAYDRVVRSAQNQWLIAAAGGATRPSAISTGDIRQQVDRVLTRGLEPEVREDVMSEMTVAVLEGRLAETDVTRQTAREFVARYHRVSGSWSMRSLDAPTSSDSNRTLHDMVPG